MKEVYSAVGVSITMVSLVWIWLETGDSMKVAKRAEVGRLKGEERHAHFETMLEGACIIEVPLRRTITRLIIAS